ncbi:MAG TPA: hypothetical protein VH518_04875 [Tepidisphaeraceae bacterium]|jgi:hypothetical protein
MDGYTSAPQRRQTLGTTAPAWVVLALLWSAAAQAQSHILTFGGGSDPGNTQISLEKNIIYFRQVLADVGMAKTPHEVYFADGGASDHAVQYRIDEDKDQQFIDFLATVFSSDAELDVRFKRVELPNLQGPSTLESMSRWMGAVGRGLHMDEHLLFYFTGHGGPDSNSRSGALRNTTMAMWDSDSCTVRRFEQELDKLDPSIEVTLVMVQCHAGGFANVIYNDGDPTKGYSHHKRCGFFATTASREAAGCTADVDEEDYQDFSTHFFAALSGKTRTGKPVTRPDYDGDGATSLSEAFAYVLLYSDTVDVPLTTSDQLLRDKSRERRTIDQDPSMLDRDAPYSKILSVANPWEKAVLEGLSKTLELDGEDRLIRARQQASRIERERRDLARRRQQADRQIAGARNRLRNALSVRWPELSQPWNAQAPKILQTELPAIRKFVEGRPAYQDYLDADDRANDSYDHSDELERKWAKLQRLVDRAQTVILQTNLPKLADAETLEVYRALVERENRPLKAFQPSIPQ